MNKEELNREYDALDLQLERITKLNIILEEKEDFESREELINEMSKILEKLRKL